ncbi:DUF4129 domain-containing protein [Haloterrigena alkaliphila]|uniref:Protein-glutamine gamma-glutamyltransferase-like C-terminal domain-containing protein n=1 Tax=Haloterrigena alkaliphila TaxID=2816475 RepID=A0A8A2VFS2_9EURY|nr:DUF4129 domain-containing protein [Haloterrigena alkaliphila]QSX00157.1 hypothetical protein J0X25_04095 [Haloterrigena alkaliphila]
MTFGSGTGRRLLTIGAVCCAVFGLLVAASAMPMVASESPASDLLGGSDDESASGAALTEEQAAAAQSGDGSMGGGGSIDGGATSERSDGMPGRELIQRAAASDNPLVQKALYGLASLASLFGGPAGAVDAGGDPAAAGVDGEFGAQLDSPAGSAAYPEIDGDGTLQGDTGASELEDGSDAPEPGDGTETGTEADGGDGETGDGGSTDGSETETDESGDEIGGEGNETDGQSSDGDTGSETDPNADGATDGAGSTTDGSEGATEPNTDGSDDGTDETSTDAGDEDAGLEDSVPGLSDGTLTAVLAVLAVAAVGYVFYTRDNPIGTLRSIPSRLVSLALSAVVACSQGLERAVARLRELRSIADLPGLVLETLRDAIRSTTTRVRAVGASLSPFADAEATDSAAIAETQVTARERIRQAFASVIDAAPMYRASVATATPAEVARRASDAGAPADPVETITDSFRDVEYGDRDPASYLDRTTSAHDQLRSALETTQSEGKTETETGAEPAVEGGEATTNPAEADANE